MSVVIAIKENGVIYMGTDTQVTSGNKKENELNKTSLKIALLDNGLLVGACGKYGLKQQIIADKSIFTLDKNNMLTKQHIVTNIIPKLSRWVKKSDKANYTELEVSFLLAHDNNLYFIGDELNVIKINNFAKIGAGKGCVDYALSCFNYLPARERIIKALVESANITESVSGPYVLIDTKHKEFEIIDLKGENH
jgi:ATP-dependent protease HslVU (ClpYQ) peptidase subunit